MFERRIVPVYLALCALGLAVWSAVAPGSAPAATLGWALAGMAALYTAAILMQRTPRPVGSVAHVLEETTADDAGRVEAPRGTSPGDVADPRR